MAFRKDLNQDLDEDKVSRINSAGIINITLEKYLTLLYTTKLHTTVQNPNHLLNDYESLLY